MKNLSLELEFEPTPDSQLHHPPVARIYVAGASGVDTSNRRYISPNCLLPAELDYQIDRLHAELENIRERGRERFARTLTLRRVK